MNKVIVNCETGEQETIPLQGAELAEFLAAEEAAIAQQAANQAEQAAKEAAKEAAQAKLAALGLTTDDLKALGLGGN